VSRNPTSPRGVDSPPTPVDCATQATVYDREEEAGWWIFHVVLRLFFSLGFFLGFSLSLGFFPLIQRLTQSPRTSRALNPHPCGSRLDSLMARRFSLIFERGCCESHSVEVGDSTGMSTTQNEKNDVSSFFFSFFSPFYSSLSCSVEAPSLPDPCTNHLSNDIPPFVSIPVHSTEIPY
jgi:hypothetical protein